MSEPTEPKVEVGAETQDSTSKEDNKVEEPKTGAPAATEEKKEDVQYGDEEEEEKKSKIENKSDLKTGTENEDLIWIQKAKLYRFRDGKWKERGNGYCKLLRHKESKKIRFLLRTEKTKKVSANFFVADSPLWDLKLKTGNDKSYLWVAQDFSEGELNDEKFAILFRTKEEAEDFEKHFNKAKEFNKKHQAGETDLEHAPVVEDIKEEHDQDDENKPHEEHK